MLAFAFRRAKPFRRGRADSRGGDGVLDPANLGFRHLEFAWRGGRGIVECLSPPSTMFGAVMKHALKLAVALVAFGVALAMGLHFMKSREQGLVHAAYDRFKLCLAGVSAAAAYGTMCGAKVDSAVSESTGHIQRCLSDSNFLRPWWQEVGLEPPTYSAVIRCSTEAGGVANSVVYAEITLLDGKWSVTTVGHTRSASH